MSRGLVAKPSAMLGALMLFLCARAPAQEQQPPVELLDLFPGLAQPAPRAPSSDQPIKAAAGKYLKDIWADQKTIWSSPFRVHRRQWLTVALPLAAGTAALIATDEKAMDLLPNGHDQTLWCARASDIGSFAGLGAIAGGTMLYGRVKGRSDWHKIGVSASQALANSFIVSAAIKRMTARERPTSNDGEGRFWKGGDTFPSGHTMCSFAVAMAIVRSRQAPRWLKVTSLGISAAVGLARWGAERHFPSDVFVGGVLGGLIGNYVGARQR